MSSSGTPKTDDALDPPMPASGNIKTVQNWPFLGTNGIDGIDDDVVSAHAVTARRVQITAIGLDLDQSVGTNLFNDTRSCSHINLPSIGKLRLKSPDFLQLR